MSTDKIDLKPMVLLEDEPVPGFSVDDLGLLPYSKMIASAALGTAGPFTIGVFGDWGQGKTSILRQAKSLIDDQQKAKNIVTVWFNAWQYEQEEHPIVPLVASVVAAIDRRASRALPKKLKNAFAAISSSLRAVAYGFSAKSKVKVPGFAELESGFVAKEMIERYEKLQSPDDPLLARSIYYSAFELLSGLSVSSGRDPGSPKVVIFVDDLDRCLPPKGLKLLESIKLVLGQPGFIFVLAVDRKVVEGYLAKRYRDEYGVANYGLAGVSYLDKIVQLPLGLPSHRGRFHEYLTGLCKRPALADEGNNAVRGAVEELADLIAVGSNYNPRTSVRLINNLIVDQKIWSDSGGEVDTRLLGLFGVSRILRQCLAEESYRYFVEDRDLCSHLSQGQAFGLDQLSSNLTSKAQLALLERLEEMGFLKEMLQTASGKEWLGNHSIRLQINEFIVARLTDEDVAERLTPPVRSARVVRTTKILPFGELSPEDFERMCFWLLRREGFENAEHLGVLGDLGRGDIVAERDGTRVVVVCKRVQRFGPSDARKEIERMRSVPSELQPHDIVFMLACQVSVHVREQTEQIAGQRVIFIAGSELDERVKRHPEIVREFFGSVF